MATLRPFRGLRPPPELADRVASRPYDVLSSREARIEAEGNEHFAACTSSSRRSTCRQTQTHSHRLSTRRRETTSISFAMPAGLSRMTNLIFTCTGRHSEKKHSTVLWDARAVSDYLNDVIRKHELTRPDKEEGQDEAHPCHRGQPGAGLLLLPG